MRPVVEDEEGRMSGSMRPPWADSRRLRKKNIFCVCLFMGVLFLCSTLSSKFGFLACLVPGENLGFEVLYSSDGTNAGRQMCVKKKQKPRNGGAENTCILIPD